LSGLDSIIVDLEIRLGGDLMCIFVGNGGYVTTRANKINAGVHIQVHGMILSLFRRRISIVYFLSIGEGGAARRGDSLPIAAGLPSVIGSVDLEGAGFVIEIIVLKVDALHSFMFTKKFGTIKFSRCFFEAIVLP